MSAPARDRADRPGLTGDDRGAILVVGLTAAVFLTGLLYFLFGIGETIRHHERMSDAADAGAYATGVMHARAMNLVALANMVKLAVTAIQTAYLAMITGAAMTIAWIASSKHRWIKYGWVVPFLVVIIVRAAGAYGGFQGDASAMTRAADRLQAAAKGDLPTIALLKADRMVARSYDPPAYGLAAADASLTLPSMPIEEGSRFDLCLRAFPFSFGMVLKASRDVPSSKPRSKFLGYSTAVILPYCLGYGVDPYQMSDSNLGSEPFQIRVMSYGEKLPALGERGVSLATYLMDDGASRGIAARRDEVSTMAFAQSEYYFDGPQDPDEMLWRMEWRARLRRFSGSTGVGSAGGLVGIMLR